MDTERTPISTHTAGPLDIKPAIKPNGSEGSWDVGIFDAEGMIIAECFEIVGPGIRRPAMANARLIAAGTDLLKVAHHIMVMADDAYLLGHPEWIEMVNEARAAIAKTQGRAA